MLGFSVIYGFHVCMPQIVSKINPMNLKGKTSRAQPETFGLKMSEFFSKQSEVNNTSLPGGKAISENMSH